MRAGACCPLPSTASAIATQLDLTCRLRQLLECKEALRQRTAADRAAEGWLSVWASLERAAPDALRAANTRIGPPIDAIHHGSANASCGYYAEEATVWSRR